MERAERAQFVEWLRESHLHVAAMLRIARIHGSLERFQGWSRIPTGPRMDADNVVQFPPPRQGGSQISQDPDSAPPAPPSPTRRIGPGRKFFACAAMLLLAVGTMTVLPQLRGHVIETERGERREVVLADGSVLQIDPQTRLRVEYADTARRVVLEQGRALFHVARNPNRPFLVQADATTVRAVGTAFGVEQRPHGVVVTVAEGKVSVSVPRLAERTAEPGPSASQGKILLTANQQLMVEAAGMAEPVRKVDSAQVLAWAEGRLIFQNDEIGQAVAQFNRYNRVQLTVTDPVLSRKPVSGVFNAAEPEAFIAFLQSVTAVEIVRDGDKSITIAAARLP
jgi:transmembrane sensor